MAVVAQYGKKPQFFSKQLLPTYDVFDEGRFFEPGDELGVVKIKNVGNVAVTICEDLWCGVEEYGKKIYENNILEKNQIDLTVNISSSPFSKNKEETRLQIAKFHVSRTKAPLVYVNQVGGQDELIFDGRSFILDKKGQVIVQAANCEEDLVIIDLGKNLSEYRPTDEDKNEILRKSLVLGLRDFVIKTGQKKVHLGLSGGIDSAVCAALAVDALGPGSVTGLLLPGPYSSSGSVTDSEKLAKNLGIKTIKIAINDFYDEGLKVISEFQIDKSDADLTEQNIQARFRGLVLMAYSNRAQSMLLSTSNKSELAAGYATLYGDMCGGLMPLGDLLKSEVYGLAKVYNQSRELIPQAIIEKAPSAELAPNQRDDDTLPPYDELDKAVVRIVEQRKTPKSAVEKWLSQALARSEFKRWQAPPILRVSEHSFWSGDDESPLPESSNVRRIN